MRIDQMAPLMFSPLRDSPNGIELFCIFGVLAFMGFFLWIGVRRLWFLIKRLHEDVKTDAAFSGRGEDYDEVQAEEWEEFKNAIHSILPQLLADEELTQMGMNFIDRFPPSFFTDVAFILRVECLLVRKDAIGSLLLLSTDESRNQVTGTIWPEEKEYLEDNLCLFANFIQERFDISDPRQAIYATYLLVYRIAIKHFSRRWAEENKGYFSDIGDLDLDGVISRYCTIDTVDPQNAVTARTFIYYLIDNQKFGSDNFLLCNDVFIDKLDKILKNRNYQNFVSGLKLSPIRSKYSIDDVDMMNGQEFEQFIALIFSRLGYQTEITKASGDQGIDVIASKGGNRIGIQAKCYSGPVGNRAIQEAVAGIKYYRLDKAMVVTNNSFTDSAKQLASANSVVLWDRNILKEKILDTLSHNPVKERPTSS